MEISITLQIHVAISIRTSPFLVYYVHIYLSVPKNPKTNKIECSPSYLKINPRAVDVFWNVSCNYS